MSARRESGVVERGGGVFVSDATFAEWKSERRGHATPKSPGPAGSGGARDRRAVTAAPSVSDARRTSRLKVTRASDVEVRHVEFLFPERVPIGALTVLAGDPGLGKSTWSCMLAADVTVGDYGPAANVLVANAEDSPEHVIVPRLVAAGADLARVEFFAVWEKDGGERPFSLPDDVSALEAHAYGVGARLVIIDPLNAHLGDAVSAKSDHSVRRALAPLAGMAQRLGIAVVVVAHLNKAAGTDALYRVGGSIGFVGGARSLLLFTRDPDDPDGEDGDRRALGHVKSNWGRIAPTLLYRHEAAGIMVDGFTVDTNRLAAAGESDIAGASLLGADGDDPPASKRERAEELLADMLGDGERHRAKEVKDAARRQGIPERTLQRAARYADVVIEDEGFPRVTYWRLEADSHSRAIPDGATVAPSGWRDCENTHLIGDSGVSTAQSRHTAEDGATGPLPDDPADIKACRERGHPIKTHPGTGRPTCARCHGTGEQLITGTQAA